MGGVLVGTTDKGASTTVRQAMWGVMRFSITAHELMGLTSMDVSESYNDDYNEKGKKIGKERTGFTVNVRYYTPVLNIFSGKTATARGMLGEWRKRLGKAYYFYVGGKKFLGAKFKLIGIDTNNFILTNKGQTMACDIQLNFIEARTTAQEKAAAKAAKTSSTGASSSGKSSGGGKITYSGASSSSWSGGKMKWPLAGHKRISSNYGWRTCPYHGKEKHSGIDIPAPSGTRITAAAAGTVVYSAHYGSYGNHIIISHGKSVWTLYAHQSTRLVSKGAKVKAGQVIGKVGTTGNSTGNHLHFEVRKNKNSSKCHVSPWNYVSK